MIEIVYKEEKQEANGNESCFYLPKNIRQIGDCRGRQKIYVEDYVYTYLQKITRDAKEAKVLILLGRYNWAEGISYLFVSSAMQIHSMEPAADHLSFDDRVWSEVHETTEQYFKGQTILGWALSLPGGPEEPNDLILKTHLNHFGGNDKAYLHMDPLENEEAFYMYEGNSLRKIHGFYVYYEKNEPMQSYMIDQSQNRSIEGTESVSDRAVSDFRKLAQERKETPERDRKKPFTYALAACAAAALVFAAVHRYSDVFFPEEAAPVSGQGVGADGYAAVSGRAVNPTETEEKSPEPSESVSRETSREPSAAPSPTAEVETIEREEDTESVPQASGEESSGPDAVPAVSAAPSPEADAPSPDAESDGTADVSETSIEPWQEYVVQHGDTLSMISERYYGTLSKIREICILNDITTEDLIYAGQKIILPKKG